MYKLPIFLNFLCEIESEAKTKVVFQAETRFFYWIGAPRGWPDERKGGVLLPHRAGAAGRVRRDPSPDDVLPAAAADQEEAQDHLPPLHRVPLPLQRIRGSWGIGCVIPRWNLQCGITQPILQRFWHICTHWWLDFGGFLLNATNLIVSCSYRGRQPIGLFGWVDFVLRFFTLPSFSVRWPVLISEYC